MVVIPTGRTASMDELSEIAEWYCGHEVTATGGDENED